MRGLVQDIRYGLRTLAARPGFTATIMLTLALAIGANTAVFRLVNAVILRTLPVRAPQELVVFEADSGGGPVSTFSYPLYRELTGQKGVISGAFAVGRVQAKLDYGRDTLVTTAEMVSGNYFAVLGVDAAAGRLLTPADDRPGAHAVCTISYGLWQRAFGGNPSALGKTVRLNSAPLTVVGVTPARFGGTEPGEAPEIRVPLALQRELDESHTDVLSDPVASWLTVIGRRKPGVAIEQVRAATQLTLDRWTRERAWKPQRAVVRPGGYGLGYLRAMWAKPLLVLLGITVLVLLIACANLATLMFARGAARRSEITVRMVLGAGRARLVRQLLAESMMLSAAGAALGLLAAKPLTSVLVSMAPLLADRRPDIDTAADWRVLVFVAVAAVATAVLCGLSPALRATRGRFSIGLKEALGGSARPFIRKALVAGQVAMCVVLLTAAGLFAGTLRNIQKQNLGFRPDNIVLLTVNPRLSGYTEPGAKAFYSQLLERVRALPGVTSAGLATVVPGSGNRIALQMSPEGYQPESGESTAAIVNWITPGYLAAMRIPVLHGRDVTVADRAGMPKVAIINRRSAERFWPGGNATGKRFNRKGPADPGFQVIGVIPDVQDPASRMEPHAQVYFPVEQWPAVALPMTLHVRSSSAIGALAQSLRAEIAALDDDLPIINIKTMEGQLRETVSSERLTAHFSVVFAALALLLAAVGLYGLVACGVAQRTREIGIRMALGAQRRHVLWLAAGETACLFAVGVAIGIPAAFAASRFASSMLFGLQAGNPMVYAGAVATLGATAAAAAIIPAQRAIRLEPTTALRYE